MSFERKIASLFILVVACGDNESMLTGVSATTATTPVTTNPATTNNPPTSETMDDTSSSGTAMTATTATDTTTSMPTTGSPPTTSTTSVEGGPVFLSFSTNVAMLTQDESVTFTAILTDPDGVDDIVGGSLHSADESLQFGPFVAAGQAGTYSISLTWAQIHQTEAIEFDGGELLRGFRAVFFDQGAHKATDDVDLALVCAGGAACDGTCTDLALDGLNCGTCGRVCDGGEDACASGACLPTYGSCSAHSDGLDTCAQICQAADESCVTQGCDESFTAMYFDDTQECETMTGANYSMLTCDEMLVWNVGAMHVRCCCTDTK